MEWIDYSYLTWTVYSGIFLLNANAHITQLSWFSTAIYTYEPFTPLQSGWKTPYHIGDSISQPLGTHLCDYSMYKSAENQGQHVYNTIPAMATQAGGFLMNMEGWKKGNKIKPCKTHNQNRNWFLLLAKMSGPLLFVWMNKRERPSKRNESYLWFFSFARSPHCLDQGRFQHKPVTLANMSLDVDSLSSEGHGNKGGGRRFWHYIKEISFFLQSTLLLYSRDMHLTY